MSIPLAQRANAPEFVPFPGEHHGIEWESLTAAHHDGLSALFARMEARDNPPYRTSPDEVEEMLSGASQWRGLVGIARRGIAAGRIVAFAQVVLRFPGRVECVCVGGVDPDFRRIGLGNAIVDWQEGTARQMLSEVEGEAPAQITCHVETGQDDLEAQLKVHGFRWTRTYYELRASLEGLPQVPDLGSYMSIEAWGPQWEEPALRAANRLNESEWGRPPLTQEQWMQGRTAFAPEWSFVAVDRTGDRPRVAGFLLASRYEQDWAALGWREGYIDQLGVLSQWRESARARAWGLLTTPVLSPSMTTSASARWDRPGSTPSRSDCRFAWWTFPRIPLCYRRYFFFSRGRFSSCFLFSFRISAP